MKNTGVPKLKSTRIPTININGIKISNSIKENVKSSRGLRSDRYILQSGIQFIIYNLKGI